MKKVFLVLAGLLFLLAGCTQEQQPGASVPVLTVYTYDSMVSEYGLGNAIVPEFEKSCDCKVKMLAKGDAGQILTTLILEKDDPKADVVIGIDNSMLKGALDANVLEPFTPKNIGVVHENIRFGEGYLTSYDYGYFAFMYDADVVESLNGFDDLLRPELRGSVAIQDPRTSSPGLGLLLWTVAVYGDPGYKEFWREFKPNILTVTDSWDASAGLFASGEAPVYLTYATSPPYYVEFEGRTNLLGASFKEGHYVQVEGMGIVKGTKNRSLAEQFIEFSLGEKFQKEIPLHQFMFPANKNVTLPDSFEEYAVKPAKQLSLDADLVAEKQGEWISEWEKIIASG